MARYEVRCEVEVPDDIQVTEEQVEDWARFNFGVTALEDSNPLKDLDLEAVAFTTRVRRLR